MPSSRVRTTRCMSLAVLLLSLGVSRTAAFASAGEGAAAPTATTTVTTTTDSAFVPPAGTSRGWFGSAPNAKSSAPTAGNRASVSARPSSVRAPPVSTAGRTWVSRPQGATRSAPARRDAMAMEAAGGSTPPPRIIIAGAPASGKGTQCSMIKERYGVVHLSTGGG